MSLRRRSALLLALVCLAPPSVAAAAAAGPGPRDRAIALVTLDHHAFLLAKAGAEPPFDWSADGCSRTPPAWALTFDGPCQQHDFGYRNLGHGLRLRATEAARRWVDGRFLTELRRVCGERYAGAARTRCRIRARTMFTAVRLFNPPWS